MGLEILFYLRQLFICSAVILMDCCEMLCRFYEHLHVGIKQTTPAVEYV